MAIREEVAQQLAQNIREELAQNIREEIAVHIRHQRTSDRLVQSLHNRLNSVVGEACTTACTRLNQKQQQPGASSSGGGGSSSSRLEEETRRLETQFNRTFEDPGSQITTYALGELDKRLKDFYRVPQTWYAPCVPIVQSRGWGKSKLMKHLASQGIVVFYFSLMAETSSGLPKADPDIRSVVCSIKMQEQAYAIFWACLDWLHEQDQMPNPADLFLQQQEVRWPVSLKQKILGQKVCSKEKMQDAFSNVWKKFLPHLRKSGVQFLFVVDEARALLQEVTGELPFTLLRRASGDFPEHEPTKSGALVVLIDTFGKVSNRAPRSGLDPSERVAKGMRNLFSPISCIPSFNVLASNQAATLEEAAKPYNLFSQGRPLWSAALQAEESSSEPEVERIRSVLNLACNKLLGGGVGKSMDDPVLSLVLLGRRIAVDVCPQDRVAEELVASHMQVCLYTSLSREFMLTAVLPEPVLAEAAADLLHSKGLVGNQLRHLNSCMMKGLVSAGERGELVARFLLVNTMDALNKTSRNFSTPQYMESFLRKLSKGQWKGFGGHAKQFKKGKVFFNAFYPFFGMNPTYETLQVFLRNAGALICKQGQRAYDLYIPFVTPNEKGEYDFSDKEHLHCLAVQVRNRKDIYGSVDTLDKMHDYAVSLTMTPECVSPSMFLLLHLGETESKGGCLQSQSTDPISLVLEGLNAIYYDADYKESLVALLRERPDPKSILKSHAATESEIKAVSSVLKQLYHPDQLGSKPSTHPKGSDAGKGKQVQSSDAGKGKQVQSDTTDAGKGKQVQSDAGKGKHAQSSGEGKKRRSDTTSSGGRRKGRKK